MNENIENELERPIFITPYLREISSQIESARNSLSSSGGIFDQQHHFLIHSAIVHKILFPSINPKEIEKGNLEELRKQKRMEALKNYFSDCKSIDQNISAKKFRNHMEHIDERIDSACKHGFIMDKNIAINQAIGDSIVMFGLNKEAKLRNIENGMLTIYGESFDINEILKWLSDIENYIVRIGHPQEKMGCMTNCIFTNS